VAASYVADYHFKGTVLVAKGDRVILSKRYGLANPDRDIPNTPSTKFRLGSITKQFTAACILLLEERGKLKVEDPVKKYMADAPPAWDKITIRNLLTHTAGIPNLTSFPNSSAEKTVARLRDEPLDFEPGSKFSYSNSGYVLLCYLVERISGESYEKFLQENIFTPLAMKDSGYDSNSETFTGGAGGLYSTTEDLLKWERGLFGGKVLSAESPRKMTTPCKGDYAFGLFVRTEEGRKQIRHNGAMEGFNTSMAYYPRSQVIVAVLANVNGPAPDAMLPKLAAAAHGQDVTLTTERKEVRVGADTLARYAGVYSMAPGVNMVITVSDGQLISQMAAQGKVPLFAESETMFFSKVADAEFEFPGGDAPGGDPNVPADQLIIHQSGRYTMAKRLGDAEAEKVLDAAAAAADKRMRTQTPTRGSEAAVRRMIEELRTGKPKYNLLSPGLAKLTRQQLPQLHATISGLGALPAVNFKGVGRRRYLSPRI
jgi:CubicO group peptidase (beta-lactamase class C family)